MNYDFNSIESLLRSGVSADEIAQAFTKNLNDAIAEAAKPTRHDELSEGLADAWNNFVEYWLKDHDLPRNVDADDLYVSAEIAGELFDKCMDLVVKTAPLFDALAGLLEEEEKPSVKVNTVAKDTAEKNLNTEDFDLLMRSFLDSIK